MHGEDLDAKALQSLFNKKETDVKKQIVLSKFSLYTTKSKPSGDNSTAEMASYLQNKV